MHRVNKAGFAPALYGGKSAVEWAASTGKCASYIYGIIREKGLTEASEIDASTWQKPAQEKALGKVFGVIPRETAGDVLFKILCSKTVGQVSEIYNRRPNTVLKAAQDFIPKANYKKIPASNLRIIDPKEANRQKEADLFRLIRSAGL